MNSQKDQIAACFEKHFYHFGFKKTSVDDVAGELHISKKTIYQYFSSKEEVLYFIIGKIANGFINDMEEKLQDSSSYQEKLTKLLKMVFSETRYWLKSTTEFNYKDDLEWRAFQDAYSQLIRKFIAAGSEINEFAKIPVDITARFINGLISESLKILSATPKINVEDDLIQAVIKLLH